MISTSPHLGCRLYLSWKGNCCILFVHTDRPTYHCRSQIFTVVDGCNFLMDMSCQLASLFCSTLVKLIGTCWCRRSFSKQMQTLSRQAGQPLANWFEEGSVLSLSPHRQLFLVAPYKDNNLHLHCCWVLGRNVNTYISQHD